MELRVTVYDQLWNVSHFGEHVKLSEWLEQITYENNWEREFPAKG